VKNGNWNHRRNVKTDSPRGNIGMKAIYVALLNGKEKLGKKKGD